MDPLPCHPCARDFATAIMAGDVRLDPAPGSSLGKLLADALPDLDRILFAVAPDVETQEALLADLALFGAAEKVHALPSWDVLPHETDHPDHDTAQARVGALRALLAGEPALVVASAPALLQPVLPRAVLDGAHLEAYPGMETAPEALAARLHDAGLEVVEMVDGPGQFCRRGGIIDVFPLLADRPVRIDWFGDEIDSIRYFDVTSQRSGPPLADPVVLIDVDRDAFQQAYRGGDKTYLDTYLPSRAALLLLHPERIAYAADLYQSGFERARSPLRDLGAIGAALAERRLAVVPELSGEAWPSDAWRPAANPVAVETKALGMERIAGGLEVALRELRLLREHGTRVSVFCQNAAERTRLTEVLLERGGGLAGELDLRVGSLSKGFHLPAIQWAAVGDHELFGRYQLRRTPRKKRYQGTPIADFAELKPGDHVVHVLHGVARYEGMETLTRGETAQDYLKLRFAEEARVYVPLSHVELVQRYVGAGDGRPKLSKLGGKGWTRRKQAAEAAAKHIAADLLRIQAVRRAIPGVALPEDDALQREFDAAFPYEETPDQLAAIADLKADQAKATPMDRLLCGDVGFGKTEVAMRAAFKAVGAGYQVAILAPTTVLAEQHLRTFRERMADYPVVVGCLSRFRSAGEQARLLTELADGRIDIMIGTHRLLSQDVEFKNLGMVVIDEEQRFGVEHKERLKAMRASIDVLTMTATPIPRTLNLALLGLRDISNLATAPTERLAVRTRVVRYSEEVIRRAILLELARGGQAFFLHNRVHNIDRIAAELSELVPEARFGIAHGQMPERMLLEVMNRFLARKIDVLVCTTIIESGVDIPTVNTLFVNGADHFGLSQLHQLRGRVGRYKHQAYAYFLVPKKRPVTPIAAKRLRALEEYSELGAGFRLALRDLEIRGAGNILGAEQSGHINLVGFDLYCRLLRRAVAELRGEELAEDAEPVEMDLGGRAFIPTDYIPADGQRVDLYRRLIRAQDEAALAELRAYLRDRYGPVPPAVDQLFAEQVLRTRAEALGIDFLGRMDGALVVGFAKGRGKEGVTKLRMFARRVTPLEGARWRVALREGEDHPDRLRAIVLELLAFLEEPLDGSARGKGQRSKVVAKSAGPLRVPRAPGSGTGSSPTDGERPPDGAKGSPHGTARAVTRKTDPTKRDARSIPRPGKAEPPPPRSPRDEALAASTRPVPPETPERRAQRATGRTAIRIGTVKASPPAGTPPSPTPPSKAKSNATAAPQGGGMTAGGPKKKPASPSSAQSESKATAKAPSPPKPGPAAKTPPKRKRRSAAQQALDEAIPVTADTGPSDPEVVAPVDPTARVLGLEPNEALGQVGAVIEEGSFDIRRFGPVTLIHGEGKKAKRTVLRYTGTGKGSHGRQVLLLRARDPEQVRAAVAAHLALGGSRLAPGIVDGS